MSKKKRTTVKRAVKKCKYVQARTPRPLCICGHCALARLQIIRAKLPLPSVFPAQNKTRVVVDELITFLIHSMIQICDCPKRVLDHECRKER